MKVPIPNAFQLSRKLLDLQPDTEYVISVSAATSAGVGLPQTVTGHTVVSSAPDKPVITSYNVLNNSVNVSWMPSTGSPVNPGFLFFVEMKESGKNISKRYGPEIETNMLNVSDLSLGAVYIVRVIAVNNVNETASDVIEIVLTDYEEPLQQQTAAASATWFILLMCVLALLVLVIVIICVIRFKRGGMYPVHEKEKLKGNKSFDDDDNSFHEYMKRPFDFDQVDNRSMEGNSMDDFEDPETSRFNEDGSFIGAYGGKLTTVTDSIA